MIRSLAADELEWFLSTYYDFIGHDDPRGFARRGVRYLRDAEAEAARSFVLFEGGEPLAGAHLMAPEPDEDDQNLYLSNIWFRDGLADLEALLGTLLRKHPHEAAVCPLFNFSDAEIRRLKPGFELLGFSLERSFDMTFDLADLPPLGMPLVLEAWSPETDEGFKEVYTASEGISPSERVWAYYKRWRGAFHPDLWFIARETLDQPPVGYAFYGAHQRGVDGIYYLTTAGVLARHRDSSEMLKRLILSSMHDLASRSPFGAIRTTVSGRDPKLIRIFELLGFRTISRYQTFTKLPR